MRSRESPKLKVSFLTDSPLHEQVETASLRRKALRLNLRKELGIHFIDLLRKRNGTIVPAEKVRENIQENFQRERKTKEYEIERERKQGWALENLPVQMPEIVRQIIHHFMSARNHLNVLVVGGNNTEIRHLKKMLGEKGFSEKEKGEKTFEFHQTSLTDKYKAPGTVFHEGITTLELSKIRDIKTGKLPEFDFVYSQYSWKDIDRFTHSLLELHKVLKPGGIACIYTYTDAVTDFNWKEQIMNLNAKFSYDLIPDTKFPPGGIQRTCIVLRKRQKK